MALLFIDGFDAGDFALKWDAGSGGTSTAGGRFGIGRHLTYSGSGQYRLKSIPATSQIFVGFAYTITSVGGGPTGGFLSLGSDGGATAHLVLQFDTSTILGLYRGATQIATAPINMPVSSWIHIEISATIDGAAGTCKVRVGGVEVINFTGNTKNGGTASTIDSVTISRPSSNNNGFDDLYICDSIGFAPYNTFIGDSRIYTLAPNGAGSSTQFTPTGSVNNWDTVDEMPYSTTDFVSANTTGNRDTYALSNLPASPGVILATQNNIIARKTDTASIGLKPVVKDGATVYYGPTKTLGSSDATHRHLTIDNPALLYSSRVLADTPVAYWRLNETSGTAFADSSGNGYTQTVLNGTIGLNQPQLITAESDGAITFTTNARTATVGTFPNQSYLTLEAWVKLANTAAQMAILDRDTEGGSNRIWQFTTVNGAVHFTFWTTAGGPYVASTANGVLSANTVYHIAATYNGTNAYIYVNGAQVASSAATGTIRATDGTSTTGVMIGAHRYGAPVYYYAGSMDEVAIYNTALSAGTISAHYTTGITSSRWSDTVINTLEAGFEVA